MASKKTKRDFPKSVYAYWDLEDQPILIAHEALEDVGEDRAGDYIAEYELKGIKKLKVIKELG